MIYRPDIQILRGLSVLFVVAFHLEMPFFKNGFLGVDVFFVISGFLMGVLYDPQQKKTFYARRAKRLLPAYFTVIFASLLIGAFLLTPFELNQLQEQVFFALPFSSNIGFWTHNSYFSKSEFNPLLHLWSLGVEIQFYLLLPLLAFFMRKVKGSIWLLLLGSLGLCLLVLTISPKTSFFMMPLRLWEFLIGYIGATRFTQNGTARPYPALGLLGFLILCALPLLPIDGTSTVLLYGHPSLQAALICGATLLILTFGLPDPLTQNLLGKGLEALGKVSYSLYLVHFPIIVFYLYRPFGGTILTPTSHLDTLLILGLITLSTAALYYGVEHRRRNHAFGVKHYGYIALCGIVLSIGAQKLKLSTYPADQQKTFAAFQDRSPYRCGKINRLINWDAQSCTLTPALDAPSHRFLFVGNSHADSLKTTFSEEAAAQNISLAFLVQNNPLMGEATSLSPAQVIAEAQKTNNSHIILHYAPNTLPLNQLKMLTQLAEQANIRLSYIHPVPVWPVHIPQRLYAHAIQGSELPSQSHDSYMTTHQSWQNDVASLGIHEYFPTDILCTPKCRLTDSEGAPLYFDSNHLTLTGSALLRPLFQNLIRESLSKN